jgi:hypothetical protein
MHVKCIHDRPASPLCGFHTCHPWRSCDARQISRSAHPCAGVRRRKLRAAQSLLSTKSGPPIPGRAFAACAAHPLDACENSGSAGSIYFIVSNIKPKLTKFRYVVAFCDHIFFRVTRADVCRLACGMLEWCPGAVAYDEPRAGNVQRQKGIVSPAGARGLPDFSGSWPEGYARCRFGRTLWGDHQAPE